MKLLKKSGSLLLIILVVTMIPMLSTKAMLYVKPYFRFVDSQEVFMPVSIHHIFQLLFTIILMLLYRKMKLSEWGFKIKGTGKALKALGWFGVIWIIYEFFVGVLPYLISKQPRALGYEQSVYNILGVLAFQGLLSGTCEEPLFRGYVMTVLNKSWGDKDLIRIKKFNITLIEVISALIFTYAHISITFIPFSVKFSPIQLLVVFVLGMVNAQVFSRTKSLLWPILFHNLSNVIVILARLVPIWLLG